MLQEAKTQCDHLTVALQTDPTIDRPSKNKPIQSIFERWVQLDACKHVDQIIPYSTEEDLENILLSYPWDVRIIGEEYRDKAYTGWDLGIHPYYNSRKHSFSSTDLRERVKGASNS